MPKSRYERGAIVRCRNQLWIVWAYPRAVKFADPIALPVGAQTAPLHRAHLRLDFPTLTRNRPVIVRTLDPQSLPRDECEQLGQLSHEIIARIGQTIERANAAIALEKPALCATM